MPVLSKGANSALTSTSVRAVLGWTVGVGVPDVDASALLLNNSGKGPDDKDFVFYNQPNHPSGAVNHAGKHTARRVPPSTASPSISVALSLASKRS